MTPTSSATPTSTETIVVTATPTLTITETSTLTPTSTVTATVTETAVVTETATEVSQATSTATNSGGTPAKVIAYPQPARDQVAFSIPEWQSGTLDIIIYNTTGELVAKVSEFNSNQNGHPSWTTQDIGPGIYVVMIYIDGKLIKSNKVAIIK